ncbi:MAG: hypothetical protein K1X74_04185 [Pirellulales bacterium]|nr:hypothetical protein [Pirellulales bacterium]
MRAAEVPLFSRIEASFTSIVNRVEGYAVQAEYALAVPKGTELHSAGTYLRYERRQRELVARHKEMGNRLPTNLIALAQLAEEQAQLLEILANYDERRAQYACQNSPTPDCRELVSAYRAAALHLGHAPPAWPFEVTCHSTRGWLLYLAAGIPGAKPRFSANGPRRLPINQPPNHDLVITPADRTAQALPQKKPKRSTDQGDGQAKLIAALNVHHQYAKDSCLNLEPIGNNELARRAQVSPSTASAFFRDKFKGHSKYRQQCLNRTILLPALKLLNQDYAPHHLFGTEHPGEVGRHGDDSDG